MTNPTGDAINAYKDHLAEAATEKQPTPKQLRAIDRLVAISAKVIRSDPEVVRAKFMKAVLQ